MGVAMKSHLSRAIRACLVGSAAAVAFFLVSGTATAASGSSNITSVAPILGEWSSDGAVIKVTGSLGAYQGTVVSGVFANCPNLDGPGTVVWKMAGSGFNYRGSIPWVKIPDCTPIGDGPTTWGLDSINHGALSSVSPDGTTADSATLTRVGTWPGASPELQSNCKRKGRRVLCAGQRNVSRDLARLAQQEAKLYRKLKREAEIHNAARRSDMEVNTAGRMNDKAVQIQNAVRGLAPPGVVDTIIGMWKLIHLPEKERGPLAAQIAGNQAKQFLFGDQADKTLAVNQTLLQTANQQYKPGSATAVELDTQAGVYFGKSYGELSDSQRLVVAGKVEGFLGQQFNFTNNAVDLGIAGVKFVNTTKGAKL
jgi:hypothetical protein